MKDLDFLDRAVKPARSYSQVCDARGAVAVFGPYRDSFRWPLRCIYLLAVVTLTGMYFGVL